MIKICALACVALGFIACAHHCWAQQASAAAALNASISDFGTSFVLDPPPICAGCVETELGFESVSDSRSIPAVVTVAPWSAKTDFSVLYSLLDSEATGHDRITQVGPRFDLVIRQQAFSKGGFLLTFAPRGAFYTRMSGGRAGLTAAPQYARGKNLLAVNVTWTGAIGVSAGNARSDFQNFYDYFRTLTPRGYGLFLGFAHELTQGQQTVGTEGGFFIPFRGGQVELEAAQLDLNSSPEWQFQSRVIVNWGKVFPGK